MFVEDIGETKNYYKTGNDKGVMQNEEKLQEKRNELDKDDENGNEQSIQR